MEDVLSSMWEDGEKAKLEAVERLMLYFESEGKKILELPNIFYPDSKFTRDHISEAFDRPNLMASLKRLADEKFVNDFEAPGISSHKIKDHVQLQLAIEAAVRGSIIASRSIMSIVAKQAGVASLRHGDLLAQLIRRNSIELDSTIVEFTPSSGSFELGELRRGIDSLPAHSEARAVDLLRPGFTRLLENTSSVQEITHIAENFGSFYPEETLFNLIRIWTNLKILNDGSRDSDPILSSLIQDMANLASSNFLDGLRKQIDSELKSIRSCIYQESLLSNDDRFGRRSALVTKPLSFPIYSFLKIHNDDNSKKSIQKLEKEWFNNFDVNNLTKLEQWNKNVVRFSRDVAMFKGTLGTSTQQLTESILFDFTDGDFGKWIRKSRDVKDAIENGNYDNALNIVHKTATWLLAILGIRCLTSDTHFAVTILLSSCISFVRNKVVSKNSFLKVKSFKTGKSFRGAKFQFVQYLIVAVLIFVLILSSSSWIKSFQNNSSGSSSANEERVLNSAQIDTIPTQSTDAP
ncbi:MAG: hypothetical protein WCR08_14455, partial [Gammaproteobacteria bacterium]